MNTILSHYALLYPVIFITGAILILLFYRIIKMRKNRKIAISFIISAPLASLMFYVLNGIGTSDTFTIITSGVYVGLNIASFITCLFGVFIIKYKTHPEMLSTCLGMLFVYFPLTCIMAYSTIQGGYSMGGGGGGRGAYMFLTFYGAIFAVIPAILIGLYSSWNLYELNSVNIDKSRDFT